MPRKPTDTASPEVASVPMTTSPAFDLWLERQMKTLMAACDHTPDLKLIDLIHRELGKRDGKITE